MTWTATLTGKRVEHGRIWIEVTYTEDAVTHVKTHNLTNTTAKHIKSLLQADVNRFDAVDPVEFNHAVGATIDITPDPIIPPDPPTQAEIDKAAWFDDYRTLQQMLQVTNDIPDLLTAQRQTQITNLQTSLDADWLNSYLGDI